jgi:hypothetical protein
MLHIVAGHGGKARWQVYTKRRMVQGGKCQLPFAAR